MFEFLSHIAYQIDLAAASIAFIALAFSVWSWANQRRLVLEDLRVRRDDDIIQWSNATIDTISRAELLLRSAHRYLETKEYLVLRDESLAALSSAVDKGRLYFPNVEADSYGIEKESAYRGHRQPILDELVAIYDLIKDLDPAVSSGFPAKLDEFAKRKRAFVSEAQSEVEPRRRLTFLKRARANPPAK